MQLKVEYDYFEDENVRVMSIIDEEKDTVMATFQDEELEQLLERIVEEYNKAHKITDETDMREEYDFSNAIKNPYVDEKNICKYN